MQVSSGRPHMLTSNQRGRGQDPVTVPGNVKSAVSVNTVVSSVLERDLGGVRGFWTEFYVSAGGKTSLRNRRPVGPAGNAGNTSPKRKRGERGKNLPTSPALSEVAHNTFRRGTTLVTQSVGEGRSRWQPVPSLTLRATMARPALRRPVDRYRPTG